MEPADERRMHLRSCRFAPVVLALSAAASTAGCFASYGLGHEAPDGGAGPSDYVCHCCGLTVLASGPAACSAACAPHCRDAGPATRPDAPLDPSCGARPVDVVCFDHVPGGRASQLTVTLALDPSECFCDQGFVCTATVTGPRTLELSTSLCPETPICRACERAPVGVCELPALEPGRWHVRVNDEDALDVDVTPPDVLPERADVCVRRAMSDGCGAIWSPTPLVVGRACHPSAVPAGTRAAIRVHEACGGCSQDGPCEVVVVDGTIRVRATTLPNSCDIACPAVCMDTAHTCLTPPLAAGSYRVVVEGLPSSEPSPLDVGVPSGPETCIGG